MCRGQGERGAGGGGVFDGGAEGAVAVVDEDGRGGAGGVFADVGECLLDRAVDGALEGGGSPSGRSVSSSVSMPLAAVGAFFDTGVRRLPWAAHAVTRPGCTGFVAGLPWRGKLAQRLLTVSA
jgi:hypothetical protein